MNLILPAAQCCLFLLAQGAPSSDPARVEELIQRLKEGGARAVDAAWRLEKLGSAALPAAPALCAALEDEYDRGTLRLQAMNALCEIGPEATDLVAQVLLSPRASLNARGCAGTVLSEYGERGRPALLQALGDPTSRVRAGAAAALGAVEGADVVRALCVASRDADADVRWCACKSLGELAQVPDIAVPALRQRLRERDEDWVQLYASIALGQFGPEARAAAPDVVGALSHRNRLVRYEAAKTLGLVADPVYAEPFLVRVVSNQREHMWVRSIAASSIRLTDHRSKTASQMVRVLKRDEPWPVRSAIVGSLGRAPFRTDEIVRALRQVATTDSDPDFRVAALKSLDKLDSRPLLAQENERGRTRRGRMWRLFWCRA